MMTEATLKNEERAVFALRSLYRRYGYTPYKMSRFEEYDLYLRSKDFLISDRIITFSDDRGRLLALKPDVTLSIVKNAPEAPGVVQKVYYNENVYRDYREILQAGLECVGDLTDYDIAEAVLLAAKSLELLGENYVLDISHMGLLAAVLDSCGFDGGQRRQVMEALRRKNRQALEAICQGIPGAWEKLSVLSACHGGREEVKKAGAVLTAEAEKREFAQLEALWTILEAKGCRICLDFSVGNRMGYYSGVVFRGYLEGISTSVLSGGQYDKLPRKLGRKARAIGFAIYLDLLQELRREEYGLDVDTLILHDSTVDAAVLSEAAEEAAKKGTVLVVTQFPRDRRWKWLVRFEKGVRLP